MRILIDDAGDYRARAVIFERNMDAPDRTLSPPERFSPPPPQRPKRSATGLPWGKKERRGEVIDYVVEKYGEDKVSQIITFGTMKAKEIGRAHAELQSQ